jgi:UDP-glucuronate 4-epimerase
MSSFVVTGAAGFIGSHLCEALSRDGHQVVGVDCFTAYYDADLKAENGRNIDIRRIDLSQDPLDGLLDGVDGIFHLAGQPGVRHSWRDAAPYLRHNVRASARLFAAAARAGRRVVFTSSSSVYGNADSYPTREDAPRRPISPYGATKLRCERLADALAQADGLDCVVLRYFSVYGPRQRPDMAFARMMDAALTGERFSLYGPGSSISRSFAYVDDVVAGTILAMERAPGGRVYNLAGDDEATLVEAMHILERVSGIRLSVDPHAPARGDLRRASGDTSRLRGELGWEPVVALQDGLRRQWAWWSSDRDGRDDRLWTRASSSEPDMSEQPVRRAVSR